MESERQANQKRNLMQAHLINTILTQTVKSAHSQSHTFSFRMHCLCLQEHLTIREHIKLADGQKQEAEEKQRNLFFSAKQKMMDLWKEREKELVRYDPTKYV